MSKYARRVQGKHPIATPREMAIRIGHVTAQIQIELQKDNIDLEQIDQWLWKIRSSSTALAGMAALQEARDANRR